MTHLVSLLFCQFSKSQSVRDISNGLRSATGNLNHMGNNIQFESVKENDLPEDSHQHILKDELIQLTGNQTKKKYPKRLRRIAIWDEQHQQTIELITNQMSRTAYTVSELYKSRWQIEIFFSEIKQLLNIKSFIGTTQNAVMIQIWTALMTIVILKFLKELAKYGWQLSNLVAFLRLNLFVKIDLHRWLDSPFDHPPDHRKNQTQGVLFH